HNLAEVERLCHRVAVIKGKLRALAKVSELRRAGRSLEVRLDGAAAELLPVLAALPFRPTALAEGHTLRVMLSEDSQAPEVMRALVAAGARIFAAVPAERPLEEVYLELIRETDQ